MKHWKIPLISLCALFLLLSADAPAGDGFSSASVPDAVFRRMQGKSYKKGCPVAREDLRYVCVRYYDLDGAERNGEIVCHKDIATDLVSIFRALHAARYPIARISLVDDFDADDDRSMAANNTSAFNYRRVAGSSRLSNHSYGRAIDVNPLYNPCVSKGGKRVEPTAGQRYADRSADFPCKITHDDLCYKLFKRHGFVWGGDWKSKKDYQHFEKPWK